MTPMGWVGGVYPEDPSICAARGYRSYLGGFHRPAKALDSPDSTQDLSQRVNLAQKTFKGP
jgi:hypothetical protein